MKTLLALAMVVLAAADASDDPSKLNGAKVLRTAPHTKAQLHYLHHIMHHNNLIFLREPRGLGEYVDILAPTHHMLDLKTNLERHGLEVVEHISDLGKLVQDQMGGIFTRGIQTMDWTDFQDYNTISTWLKSLPTDHPDLCTLEEVGKSYEGRVLHMLTVGKGGANRPGIFIDGGIHAREWITPATVTYIINELVTNSSAYDDLLSNVNFYFMPLVNPDGYAYTFSGPPINRLWSKTRSDTGSPKGCVGADPNRNWDFHWNEVGSRNNSCKSQYAGSEPFSEVETRVVRDQILKLGSKIKVYISFHSYGQTWTYPWGYTADLPKDWKDLDILAQDAVSALTAVHGTKFLIGSTTNIIHLASGGSADWVKAVANIKYAYMVELADFFILDPKEIIPCGQEVFAAILVIADFVKNFYST